MTEERTLQTSRTLPYFPQEIYNAFASAEVLATWWGPEGFTNTFEVFEFTPGGQWKFVMHSPDGNNYQNESIFQELVPDRKIVIEHVCAPHFTLTIELIPVSEGTRLTWEQMFDDAQTAQAISRLVGDANEQNLDRLTGVLSQAKQSDS